MQEDVLARVEAAAPRRWTGVAMLTVIGTLVIYVALATPPALGWQVFLIVVGVASFWLAQRMWLATQDAIELTRTELRTRSGQIICRIKDIEAVESGAFAFKPSNGFLVKTRSKGGYHWAPGLWWRVGHRVGVGGMISATETKFMLQMLSAVSSSDSAGGAVGGGDGRT